MEINPIYRNIIIGILCFFSMMLGTAITINTFRLIFNYESLFSYYFKISIYPTIVIFIITISCIYFSPNIFKKLYYYEAILLSWYMYNLWAFIIYWLLNLIVNLGSIINFILFVGIGTVITIYGTINDRHPKFDEKKIYCSKLQNGDSITIIHLTDIHLGACYDEDYVKDLVNKILIYIKEKSIVIDFVVITGDLIDGNIRLTKEMLEPFNQITCPIYYVAGNHEDYTWKEEAFNLIENNSNFIHMSNNVVNYRDKVNIIGVDYHFFSSETYNNLNNLLQGIDNNLPNIFLYHTPLIGIYELRKYNIFLFLCGHMHGGQMFPFSLIGKCLGKKIIFEGLYESYENGEEHYVYCCSGTGTQGPCTRTFITPNIGVLTIEGKN